LFQHFLHSHLNLILFMPEFYCYFMFIANGFFYLFSKYFALDSCPAQQALPAFKLILRVAHLSLTSFWFFAALYIASINSTALRASVPLRAKYLPLSRVSIKALTELFASMKLSKAWQEYLSASVMALSRIEFQTDLI
jgi:hypothetical protein